MEIGKITSKGQITIPKEIRDALRVSGGDKILFININGNIVLKKAEDRGLISTLDQIRPMEKSTVKIIKGLRNEWD